LEPFHALPNGNTSMGALARVAASLLLGCTAQVCSRADEVVNRYISTQNWVAAYSGIDFLQGPVTSFASLDTVFFATLKHSDGSNGPVFISKDNALPPGDTVEIYPNPATGMVTILSGGTSIYGVRVLNVLGTEVIDVPNEHASECSLDLSKLPAGTYFARIETANGIVVRKILKE
jgi:hypothetical protein